MNDHNPQKASWDRSVGLWDLRTDDMVHQWTIETTSSLELIAAPPHHDLVYVCGVSFSILALYYLFLKLFIKRFRYKYHNSMRDSGASIWLHPNSDPRSRSLTTLIFAVWLPMRKGSSF